MADDQKPPENDDTNDQKPSNEGSNSIGSDQTTSEYYLKAKKQAPGAQEEDDADNPEYDKSFMDQQELDSQILTKQRIGKCMAITAAFFLLASTLTFFVYAIVFAHGFIGILENHIHAYSEIEGEKSIIPFLIPFMPATLFAALGVATMVTAMRFM